MRGFLLDTDTCIEFLKGKYKLDKKVRAVGTDACFISSLTLAELYFGAFNSSNQKRHLQQVARITELFRIISTNSVERRFGMEKARLPKIGRLIPDFDLMIGSTAVEHDLVLVTNNVKHHERIDEIVIENWIQMAQS